MFGFSMRTGNKESADFVTYSYSRNRSPGTGIMRKLILILTVMLSSNGRAQTGPEVVSAVDLNLYKGTWYEIARLPNSFEKNLKCTTANYTLRSDGRITVLNSGVKINGPSKPKTAKGVAWIPDPKSPSKLNVRFFWPFSGDYWIMALDKDYTYALIGEPARKYLWILCRNRVMDDKVYSTLLDTAVKNGYDVSTIIKVAQDCN
jgi:apolipoprotein D and lipocalin family protein